MVFIANEISSFADLVIHEYYLLDLGGCVTGARVVLQQRHIDLDLSL